MEIKWPADDTAVREISGPVEILQSTEEYVPATRVLSEPRTHSEPTTTKTTSRPGR